MCYYLFVLTVCKNYMRKPENLIEWKISVVYFMLSLCWFECVCVCVLVSRDLLNFPCIRIDN